MLNTADSRDHCPASAGSASRSSRPVVSATSASYSALPNMRIQSAYTGSSGNAAISGWAISP